MPQPSTPRYAIYYTPARAHPLTVAASSWLGRDAFGRVDATNDPRPEADVLLTSEPRRYGFHATIKPPFRLKEGTSVEDLEQALSKFAGSRPPCPIGPLRIDLLGGFFALVPANPMLTLRNFAAQIVEEFDRFRAPMIASELQRRLQTPLDEIETVHLVRWGYPYVLDRFRFHMTLTGRVPEEGRAQTRARLKTVFENYLSEDYRLDTLSLFAQERDKADFVVRSQFALKSAALLAMGI
ncbi:MULTISPECIES: DUF1045 domain-containing protein [unclassified Sinorhizobium]|uniref:DUF1045 domain-containing protein n=1 Tax=unclassified Sinorhizobium TaxID=2613772 RepID=UPI0024C2CE7C|nr:MULTISPECIES: DUF1045 domain-containing protein [unclassified Sinorhizobium]MDK1378137.1 DUF1045 domain-containing protein [Sinorhizobium sp. 6-70]MDK1483133.1 DUF1045 domain-containing protein [Sinorhizobium sp. 6-117]